MAEAATIEAPVEAPLVGSDVDHINGLPQSRCQLIEYKTQCHLVVPEDGTPWEHLLRPDYWVHNATRFSPWDTIVVNYEGDDACYYARLLVRSVEPLAVNVSVLEKVDLDHVDMDAAARKESAYFVKWRGPHPKWCVIRRSDELVVSEGHQEKAKAQRWIQTSAPRI